MEQNVQRVLYGLDGKEQKVIALDLSHVIRFIFQRLLRIFFETTLIDVDIVFIQHFLHFFGHC